MESHLRYANVIWGGLSKTKLDTLQRLHDRAHSIIENARIKDEWSANWLSVENLIRFDRSVMAYKILNKLSPESLWNNIDPHIQIMKQGIVRICRSQGLERNMPKKDFTTLP